MTHYIKHLSFGEDYPGIVNPLDHTNVTAPQGTTLGGGPFSHQNPARHPRPVLASHTASMMFQYFVKVVPTVYMKVDGEVSGAPRGLPASNTASTHPWALSDPHCPFWARACLVCGQ